MVDLKKLRESSTQLPKDFSSIALWVNAGEALELLDLLEAAQADAARNKIDAECFRWWVHEAAANPVLVAKAIAHCVTEDEYREVICGAMAAKDAVISAAMSSKD